MKFEYHFDSSSVNRNVSKKTFVILLVFWIIMGAILWYVWTPALSFKSEGLIFYSIFVFGLLKIISMMISSSKGGFFSGFRSFFLKDATSPGIARWLYHICNWIALLSMAWIFISPIVTSPFFQAKSYANRIQIDNVDFDKVEEVDFTKTPIIDRDSTIVLGDRVMGEMPELVSQFEVSTEYTQVSYKDSVYRVTPLEYAGFVKYLGNREQGIPAYITVNSVTGEAKLVKLKDLGLDGMKYVPSGYFNDNLYRRLQMQYPTAVFGTPSFEIDDEGHPWYICTIYDFSGFETRKKVSGVVLFDPITGESTKYDDVLKAPKWVDRIYPESLVMDEVDNHGSLQSGFINSILGQKNVTVTSEGYNYLEQNGDIYIYSGITSVNEDASNLGFVLVNLRTHDAMKIASAGANESSAMSSAQGEVKNFGYTSTFPLLVNVSGSPVYMMSLKDDNGLIKMYAMVDATNYQKVATIESDEGFDTLKKKFLSLSSQEDVDEDELESKTITIQSQQVFNVEGKTKCFIVDQDGQRYKVTLTSKNEDILAFIKIGDTLQVQYVPDEEVNIIKKLEK